MAKEKHHLKLTFRGVVILVVFVVGLLIGTYFFAGYMLTGSKAASDSSRDGASQQQNNDSFRDGASQQKNHDGYAWKEKEDTKWNKRIKSFLNFNWIRR